jgi:hypothetical protein
MMERSFRKPMQRPVPQPCEWCGRLVALAISEGNDDRRGQRVYELLKDEKDRLLMDENDAYILSGEHFCKVRCGGCGELVIMESGRLFEPIQSSREEVVSKPESFIISSRKLHQCRSSSSRLSGSDAQNNAFSKQITRT